MTKILKKDGVEIMGEHRIPNPPFPGGHNTAFTPTQGLTDQVIRATQDAQREALTSLNIEDDAVGQLEANDRFACGRSAEYTVDEIVDMMTCLRADCKCYQDLIDSDLLTKSVRVLLVEKWYTCEAELRRLKGARVVV